MEKRRTHTSTAVKQRYNNKNYVKMTVQIKPELDADIRAYLDRKGISRSEFLQRALDVLVKQDNPTSPGSKSTPKSTHLESF